MQALDQSFVVSHQDPPNLLPPDMPLQPRPSLTLHRQTLRPVPPVSQKQNSNETFDNVVVIQQKTGEEQGVCLGCITCGCLKQMIQTTTWTVCRRLGASLAFWANYFFQIERTAPDLYGPFWIFNTLTMAIPVSSNLAHYISRTDSNASFVYDFKLLPLSFAMLHSLGIFVPPVLTLLLKVTGSSISFREMYSLYGYSYFVMIVGVFICIWPNSIGQICTISVVFIINIVFLLNTINSDMAREEVGSQKYFVLLVILLFQVGVAVVFRLLFFDSIYGSVPQTVTLETNAISPESAGSVSRHFRSWL